MTDQRPVVSDELVEKAKSYFYGTATWGANLQERTVGMRAALEAVLPDIERPLREEIERLAACQFSDAEREALLARIHGKAEQDSTAFVSARAKLEAQRQ